MKKLSLLFIILLMGGSSIIAQRKMTGKVTDENGGPLAGVTVFAKGITASTITGIDGKYSLNVPDGTTVLVFSYTGYAAHETTIGASNEVNVILAETASEAIVTAFGMERSERGLGYAAQQVDGSDIVQSQAGNTIDALVGKAAGIQVTRSSGSVGGGSRILVRGVTTMLGNNQPLIVINGVRTNNETLLSQASNAGTAASNRLMDLNLYDIENVSVLKGAAATSLYGTAGAAGVVLITTKKGKKGNGFNVGFSSSIGFDKVTNMIDLQDVYAQGRGGIYRGPSTIESGSWGPKMSELEYATDPNHPNAPGPFGFDAGVYKFDKNGFLVPKGTGNGQPAKVYNNVDPFFQTGLNFTNSLSVSGGGNISSFRLSLSDRRANGVVPNEEYDRKTIRLALAFTPFKNLTISGTANHTISDYTRIQQGSNFSGLMLGMLRTPVSFDNSNGFDPKKAVDEMSAYQFPDLTQRNYRGGFSYDNPYWSINHALGFEDVTRTFGNVKTDYEFNDWLSIGVNVGYDQTNDVRKQEHEIGSGANRGGAIQHDEFVLKQFDSYFYLQGGGRLNDDIGLNYMIGANAFSFKNERSSVLGTGLGFPGFVDTTTAGTLSYFDNIDEYRSLGFVGLVEASYSNLLYLTLSARQDYDSRLGNPTDFKLDDTGRLYPSASLAFVFSEMLDNANSFSFGKLRLSYAQAGGPPPQPYLTQSIFDVPDFASGFTSNLNFPVGGISGLEQSSVLGNPELKPELSTTLEVGMDLRFLNGKLGLDATYYRTKTKDLILTGLVTPSVGHTSAWLNAGEMTSRGIELVLNVSPIQLSGFDWETQINFTKSESIIDKLAPGVEKVRIAGFTGTGNYIVEGFQYGVIMGGAYLRTGAGTSDQGLDIPGGAVVINDNFGASEYGYEMTDPVQRVIGNPNPDFILGWNNTLTYKKFSLNFLLDWREGGDLWNGTAKALSFFGRTQLTADTREGAAVSIQGVKQSDGTPNDIVIVKDENYWTSSVGGFGSIDEQFVQDGGWVRLRELGLSYRLSAKGLFKGGSVGMAGRNLWFHTDYDGIDPETSLTGTGNGQGLDYFNMPGRKSFIINLNVNF